MRNFTLASDVPRAGSRARNAIISIVGVAGKHISVLRGPELAVLGVWVILMILHVLRIPFLPWLTIAINHRMDS